MQSRFSQISVVRWFQASLIRKIGFGLGLLAAIMLLSVGGVFYQVRQQQGDATVINVAGRQRMLSQRIANRVLRVVNGETEAIKDLRAAATLFDQSLVGLQQGSETLGLPPASAEATNQLAVVADIWQPAYQDIQIVLAAAEADSLTGDEAAMTAVQDYIQRSEALLVESNKAVQGFEAEAQAKVQTMRWYLLGMATLFLGVFVLILNATRRAIRPLHQLTRVSASISSNDLATLRDGLAALARGDLTESATVTTQLVEWQSSDEIGQLAGAFNQMIDQLHQAGDVFDQSMTNLRQLITGVIANADEVNTASQKLSDIAGQTSLATNQIATTIHQVTDGTQQQAESVTVTATSIGEVSQAISGIARGAQEQSAAINSTQETMLQLAETIETIASGANRQATSMQGANQANQALNQAIAQISDYAQQMADQIRHNLEIAQNGQTTAQETVRGIDQLGQTTSRLSDRIGELGRRSAQIGAIVEVIDDIAAQTNLLALNAAIEAARAGENGRGFAVVADEVRKLAERSSGATQEIRDMIVAVQSEAEQAASAMQQAGNDVQIGVNLTREAGQAFEAIAGGTADSVRQVEVTLEAVEIIQSAAQQLKTNLASVEAVTNQNRSTVTAVKQMSETVATAMHQASAVVEENTATTEEMAASAAEVAESIDQIAAVSEENSAAVQQVSASTEEVSAQVESVKASAHALSEMSRYLNQAVSQFKLGQFDVRSNSPAPNAIRGQFAVAGELQIEPEMVVAQNGYH